MVEQKVDRKTKQAYLITEVKDQGYDLDHFTQYMLSVKDDGADIDNWTAIELAKVVSDYKGLPQFVFKRNPIEFTNTLLIEETSSLNFKITIGSTNETFFRTYKQIEDTFEKLIRENPHVYFAKPLKQKCIIDIRTNKILEEHLETLKVCLEHLYANKGLLNSKLCTAFFNDEFEMFEKVLNTYKPVMSPLSTIYKNFNAVSFKKMLQTPNTIHTPLLTDSLKFPEHIDLYMKYVDKYLEKNESIWGKYHALMSQLQLNIKATSDTCLKLGEVTIELYHQTERLNNVIHSKEEGLKKVYIEINKSFFNTSIINRFITFRPVQVLHQYR